MNLIATYLRLTLSSAALFAMVLTAQAVSQDVPSFSKEPIYSPNAALVSKVVSSAAADIVFMDGGLEQGLRLGMVCTISRGFQEIGELIIIESRSDRSAGLILELANDSIIQAGDIARVKSLQTS